MNQDIETTLEGLFKIRKRNSSIRREMVGGVIQFLSIVKVLAVNPSQLARAGYSKPTVVTGTALSIALTCLLTGLFGNLPFICAPTLPTAIYLTITMRTRNISLSTGNTIVFLVGCLLITCTHRKLADSLKHLMPNSIQIGICLGVCLLVSLEALFHVGLVVRGRYSVLEVGDMWSDKALIAMSMFILIGSLCHYNVKGAYAYGMIIGSLLSWSINNSWPEKFVSSLKPSFSLNLFPFRHQPSQTDPDLQMKPLDLLLIVVDLFIISSVKLGGLTATLGTLAGLDRKIDSSGFPPRSRWLYFSCGVGTLLAAAMGAGPILLSAETAVAIMSGARTGLSTIICGIMFLFAASFYPIWAAIPAAGTGPVLLMTSVILFGNTSKVNWDNISEAMVVFSTAIICGFTCSIIHGVAFGYIVYIVMKLVTGELQEQIRQDYGEHLMYLRSHLPFFGRFPEFPYFSIHFPTLSSSSSSSSIFRSKQYSYQSLDESSRSLELGRTTEGGASERVEGNSQGGVRENSLRSRKSWLLQSLNPFSWSEESRTLEETDFPPLTPFSETSSISSERSLPFDEYSINLSSTPLRSPGRSSPSMNIGYQHEELHLESPSSSPVHSPSLSRKKPKKRKNIERSPSRPHRSYPFEPTSTYNVNILSDDPPASDSKHFNPFSESSHLPFSLAPLEIDESTSSRKVIDTSSPPLILPTPTPYPAPSPSLFTSPHPSTLSHFALPPPLSIFSGQSSKPHDISTVQGCLPPKSPHLSCQFKPQNHLSLQHPSQLTILSPSSGSSPSPQSKTHSKSPSITSPSLISPQTLSIIHNLPPHHPHSVLPPSCSPFTPTHSPSSPSCPPSCLHHSPKGSFYFQAGSEVPQFMSMDQLLLDDAREQTQDDFEEKLFSFGLPIDEEKLDLFFPSSTSSSSSSSSLSDLPSLPSMMPLSSTLLESEINLADVFFEEICEEKTVDSIVSTLSDRSSGSPPSEASQFISPPSTVQSASPGPDQDQVKKILPQNPQEVPFLPSEEEKCCLGVHGAPRSLSESDLLFFHPCPSSEPKSRCASTNQLQQLVSKSLQAVFFEVNSEDSSVRTNIGLNIEDIV